MALRQVWLDQIDRQNYIHASIQATLYNAHFDCKGIPWTAEDLLGRGDRAKRQREALEAKIMTAKMMERVGTGPVPEWALEVQRNSKGIFN